MMDAFMFCDIAQENIGTKEWDNRFYTQTDARLQMCILRSTFRERGPITFIGWCFERPRNTLGELDYPLVMEDAKGNRFWMHAPYDVWKEQMKAESCLD